VNREARKTLLTLLLDADGRAPDLYHVSPEFRAAMDGIVALVPAIVVTAADQAIDSAAYREVLLKGLEGMPAPRIVFEPGEGGC
jgi:hypothetical protein